VRASLASYRFRNDQALPELAAIRGEALPVYFFGLDYLEGRCLLNRLDPAAGIPLLAFLASYPGSDYRKDVANRLSYHYLLTGDTARFFEYRELVPRIGQELRDRDHEAALECHSGGVPHTGLLRARLLFDGGYFRRADSVLSAIDPASLAKTEEKLEFHYRRGRLLQETGRQEEAIQELMYTVNYGMGEPSTWPCRAALNLGQIYEARGDYGRAAKWYGSSLSLFDEEHTVESVKQRAEKGRERCRRQQE
jgi:tetratricopeptide (TPR) repeat protein